MPGRAIRYLDVVPFENFPAADATTVADNAPTMVFVRAVVVTLRAAATNGQPPVAPLRIGVYQLDIVLLPASRPWAVAPDPAPLALVSAKLVVAASPEGDLSVSVTHHTKPFPAESLTAVADDTVPFVRAVPLSTTALQCDPGAVLRTLSENLDREALPSLDMSAVAPDAPAFVGAKFRVS